MRPLFHPAFSDETQVIISLLSADEDTDVAPLAINAASAALAVSSIPFQQPVGAVRVGARPRPRPRPFVRGAHSGRPHAS